MREFKGTPGPWIVIEHSWSDTSIYSGDKEIVTKSIYHEATEETQETLEAEVSANARLIACSPELLEALQGMISFIQSNGISIPADISTAPIGIAKAAIAKALGTPNETDPITQSNIEREANNG